jgi:glycerol-3-phosphate dehydrogenase (NAD(P)+)
MEEIDQSPSSAQLDAQTPVVAVLGAGSYGTALANHLACAGKSVTLWARSENTVQEINRHQSNESFLPGVTLHPSLRCTSDFAQAVSHAAFILVAVPSSAFKEIVDCVVSQRMSSQKNSAAAVSPDNLTFNKGAAVDLIWACKGLDPKNGGFLSDYLQDHLPTGSRYAIISGPTFAGELAMGLPTAITAAASDLSYAREVADLLHTERFRVYTSADIKGVQFGGALKNVYAIAAGVSDGLGFGANARVALITRGLAELVRMAEQLDIQRETMMGLAGVGDLILTCTDDQSRNRRFGLALARGLSVDDARRTVGQAVEGIAAIRAAHRLSIDLKIDMPIVEQLFEVIENDRPPMLAVQTLLARKQREETR